MGLETIFGWVGGRLIMHVAVCDRHAKWTLTRVSILNSKNLSLNVVAIAAAYLITLACASSLELGAVVILVVLHAPLDVLVEAHILFL